MSIHKILASIDSELSKLRVARALLSQEGLNTVRAASKPKRKLSAEARKKIADAQRKRWAQARKTAKKA